MESEGIEPFSKSPICPAGRIDAKMRQRNMRPLDAKAEEALDLVYSAADEVARCSDRVFNRRFRRVEDPETLSPRPGNPSLSPMASAMPTAVPFADSSLPVMLVLIAS